MKKSIKLCSVALMLAGCGVAGMFSASADTPAPKAGEAAVSAVGKALEKADFLAAPILPAKAQQPPPRPINKQPTGNKGLPALVKNSPT